MNHESYRTESQCRVCRGENLRRVFSFGPTPPANAFLREDELQHPEPTFPLDVYFCTDCTLLQLLDVVDPELLFRNYVYVSSTSPVFIAHFERYAAEAAARFLKSTSDLVVDVGSNDGVLLKPFAALGCRVLGIDPARSIAERASAAGIPTVPEFFTPERARQIVGAHGRARIVTANNVFAHTDDLDGFVTAVGDLLDPRGVCIIEAAYLVDFLEKKLFDTVYHEHLCYYALRPLLRLFSRLGMEVFDASRVPTHGGSLRVYVQRAGGPEPLSPRVATLLEAEARAGIGELATYERFAEAVAQNKRALCALLAEEKARGKRIAGYGAPAKGNTLLHYFGIGADALDYIVDDSVYKQGLFTPGTHIPVVSASSLERQRPDYLLLLAWNFAEPLIARLVDFKTAGGKFILPVPEPRIV